MDARGARIRIASALAAIAVVVPGTVEAAVPGTVEVATSPAELHVAAASDLRFALEDIARQFERLRGARVRITLGSSGQLAAQIEQGAPFDVFFSADEAFVRTLVEKGAMLRDSIRLYAVGRIVLWVRADSPLDVAVGLGALTDPRVRYVAIANPAHAPYGVAAEQALKSAGVYQRVRSKLVLGENISQTLQYVQTGNAEAGIVALSLAVAPTVRMTGRYWPVPSYLHRSIRQAAGVTARSVQPTLAAALVGFVNGPSGREIMRRYGFTLPGEQL